MDIPMTVGVSPTLGIRGMLASRAIKAGEVVERCPVVLVDAPEHEHLVRTVLANYYFDWDRRHMAIVLGYGSLINHSFAPNAKYRYDYRNKYLVFVAVKPIAAEEEVTVNYNGDPGDLTPLPLGWTDVNRGAWN
jgi:SET domain-containing protein